MKQRFCEHCWYDVVRTTHPPASRGVIVGILFWPHKEPIRYRILAIFLAPTFGRYHLNWSGLSVNHLTLIRSAISGTRGRIENFKKNRALCNYLRPPSWLNEYSCLTFFTGRQVTEEVKKFSYPSKPRTFNPQNCFEMISNCNWGCFTKARRPAGLIWNAPSLEESEKCSRDGRSLTSSSNSEIFVIGQCFHAACDRTCPAWTEITSISCHRAPCWGALRSATSNSCHRAPCWGALRSEAKRSLWRQELAYNCSQMRVHVQCG